MSNAHVKLLACTTAFEGLRAGAGTFRVLVDLPARFRIGPVAFAEFSRATDLSTAGFIFWAVYGIGGAAFTGTTWWVMRRRGAARRVRALCGAAALCSVFILVMTTQAAPLMLRVGSASNDVALLSHLIELFVRWTILRIACADLSFCALLMALAHLAMNSREARPRDGSLPQPALSRE
ncbi:MAG TPA: hypothetical protein VG963_24450 [Polyangiaceae bacterium]|nr:hypothetical protein [Polyangiaceae bacterium]